MLLQSRVEAIKHMAESLWELRGDAKAASEPPAPTQGTDRRRRRGAGALMSAALAAELSNNAELDGPARAAPARFLQVDGCDDASSADEGAQTQAVASAAATHEEPAQPSAGPWDSGITLSHAVQSTAGPAAGVQPPQHAFGGPLQPGEPAATAVTQLQRSMPAYLLGGQQPSEHLLGQPGVPSAEALTAQLQQEIGSLSRVLGPAEAMRQALQRQMAAVQQGNAALHQLRAGHSALPQTAPPPVAAPAPAQAHAAPVYGALQVADAQQQAASAAAPVLPASASWAACAPPTPGPIAALSAPRQQDEQPCSMPPWAQPTTLPAHARPLDMINSPAAQAPTRKSAPAMPQPAQTLDDLHGSAAQQVPDVAMQRPLSAGFDSAEEAAAVFGRPTARTGQPPSGAQAALVSCAGCGMRMHLGCLPEEVQGQVGWDCRSFKSPYTSDIDLISNSDHSATERRLASFCLTAEAECNKPRLA